MDAILIACAVKASPLFWFAVAIMAGSLFGALTGLWLPPVTPLFAG